MNGARWLLTAPTGAWLRVCPEVLARPCVVPYWLFAGSVMAHLVERRL